MVLHHPQRAFRVEAVRDDGRRTAASYQPECSVQSVDVEHRQDDEYDVVGKHGWRVCHPQQLVEVGQQRAVGQHRPLGLTRGARCVDQHGQALGIRLKIRRRGRADGQAAPFIGTDLDDRNLSTGSVTDCLDRLAVSDHELCPGGRQNGGNFGGRVRIVDRHCHQASAHDAEIRGDELKAVPENNRHAVTAIKAARRQPTGHSTD